MAGYVFFMSDEKSVDFCCETGIYSTRFKNPPGKNKWLTYQEAVFTDYLSMKPRDNIYFFNNRNIFGIGELLNVGSDCKYNNFKGADLPINPQQDWKENQFLFPFTHNEIFNYRWGCFFKPSPFFFEAGVDMDEVLASNLSTFTMLRSAGRVSFVKLDDSENKALRAIILAKNRQSIESDIGRRLFNTNIHQNSLELISDEFLLNTGNIMSSCHSSESLNHEMALEAGVMDSILNSENIFGRWDYLNHQVIASPFKPLIWVDKMDIFGYRYIPGFDAISDYILIENKRDSATNDSIAQTMKYVDWINQQYSGGDYSMINAFIVAYDFPDSVLEYATDNAIRQYTKGHRPITSGTWDNLRLIKYRYVEDTKTLAFEEIDYRNP